MVRRWTKNTQMFFTFCIAAILLLRLLGCPTCLRRLAGYISNKSLKGSIRRGIWIDLFNIRHRRLHCKRYPCADSLLTSAKQFEVIIIDEGTQAHEADLFQGWMSNLTSTRRIIVVGDPAPLGPVVATLYMNRNHQPVNAFNRQLAQSYFERLIENGYSFYMLHIQHRATVGLLEFINKTFYKGKLIDGSATVLTNRPITQAFLEWMKTRYHINRYISAIYLNIIDEVTLAAGDVHSRYNVNDIVIAPISLTWTEISSNGELSSFTMRVQDCISISHGYFSRTKSVLNINFEVLKCTIVIEFHHHLHTQ